MKDMAEKLEKIAGEIRFGKYSSIVLTVQDKKTQECTYEFVIDTRGLGLTSAYPMLGCLDCAKLGYYKATLEKSGDK